MKILVAIANYGTKNQKYIKRLIEEYRSMTRYQVDMVVLSNIPKDFGPDVNVVVGLPIKNPWSLPFGHKTLFAERMQKYDLFIYSEDDTLITEINIDSFIKVTQILADEYIAGFIRYEISGSGNKYYSTIHAHYHWDPNSIIKIGEYIFAHYTNEHSACFIMTQKQLNKAINSGGFLLPPRKGRYDMLVTAATDPYTQCGMKKLICISHLNDFCLHHLPNVYCGKIGLPAELADREIERLKSLYGTNTARGPLFNTKVLLEDDFLDKKYYESCRDDILSLVPNYVKRVLSVGCGCGSTEAELVIKGIEVVGIPLDCVVQVTAEARGVKMLSPEFETAIKGLENQRFDCILLIDVLHYLDDPINILKEFCEYLNKDGTIVVSVPNFQSILLLRRFLTINFIKKVITNTELYETLNIHLTTFNKVRNWMKKSLLDNNIFIKYVDRRFKLFSRLTFGLLDKIFCRNVIVIAKRSSMRIEE